MKSKVQMRMRSGSHSAVGWTGGVSIAIDGSPDVGGKLLSMAVGGCYTNTLLGEAALRGIQVRTVDVEVETEWGGDLPLAKK